MGSDPGTPPVKKRPKIGIDCLFADPAKTFGTWVYAKNLLDEITRADPETDYVVFLSSRAARDLTVSRDNLQVHVSWWARMSGALRVLYQNVAVPLYARSKGLSLLHSMGNYGPIFPLVPSVVTVHDLLPSFDSNDTHAVRFRIRAFLLDHLMRRSFTRATAISADSKFTRRQVEATYPESWGKIRVIYGGLPSGRSGTSLECESVLCKHRVVPPYVLTVGLYPPHKNIGRFIEAFAKLKREAAVPHSLVLVGNPHGSYRDLCRIVASQGVSSHVTFTGRVSDEELLCLYQRADLFVYPSLMEGFGLPLLEAMANGIPVACSSAGPLPEVAGDAAVLFDPTDVIDIGRAIRGALENTALRERLKDAGLKRVSHFTFRRAAEEMLDLYREVLDSDPRSARRD